MKKMPAPITKPAPNKHKGINKNNHTLKLAKKKLTNLEQYELLRHEFIDTNPNATDIEIIKACIVFAGNCGLALSEKLLEINLHRLGCKNVD